MCYLIMIALHLHDTQLKWIFRKKLKSKVSFLNLPNHHIVTLTKHLRGFDQEGQRFQSRSFPFYYLPEFHQKHHVIQIIVLREESTQSRLSISDRPRRMLDPLLSTSVAFRRELCKDETILETILTRACVGASVMPIFSKAVIFQRNIFFSLCVIDPPPEIIQFPKMPTIVVRSGTLSLKSRMLLKIWKYYFLASVKEHGTLLDPRILAQDTRLLRRVASGAWENNLCSHSKIDSI